MGLGKRKKNLPILHLRKGEKRLSGEGKWRIRRCERELYLSHKREKREYKGTREKDLLTVVQEIGTARGKRGGKG